MTQSGHAENQLSGSLLHFKISMKKLIPKIVKLVAFGLFAIVVVTLLILDSAILLMGQIGFLTVLVYYFAFIVCGAVYWITAFVSGIKNSKWYEPVLTVAFAIAPLLLPVYGDMGPA